MHSGRYNIPAINPEKHASSGYKKLEERQTEKKKKEEGGDREGERAGQERKWGAAREGDRNEQKERM
jgi:hypothetical protein